MALRGNLRDFTITQLLNLVNLAQKTGTLVVDGPTEQAFISFRDGKLAYARVGQDDGSLAMVLHKANKLTVNQYRAIVERAGKITDKELGLLLINAGYLSQEEILLNLQSYFTEIIRRLFTWVEGFFRFEGEIHPATGGSRLVSRENDLQDRLPVFPRLYWLLVVQHTIDEMLHLLREAVVPGLFIDCEGPAFSAAGLLDGVAVAALAVGVQGVAAEQVGRRSFPLRDGQNPSPAR